MFATKDDEKDGPGIIAITSDQSYCILICNCLCDLLSTVPTL